jgi:hypothetical protein
LRRKPGRRCVDVGASSEYLNLSTY